MALDGAIGVLEGFRQRYMRNSTITATVAKHKVIITIYVWLKGEFGE